MILFNWNLTTSIIWMFIQTHWFTTFHLLIRKGITFRLWLIPTQIIIHHVVIIRLLFISTPLTTLVIYCIIMNINLKIIKHLLDQCIIYSFQFTLFILNIQMLYRIVSVWIVYIGIPWNIVWVYVWHFIEPKMK
jgi:hypothetical protein